MPGPAREATALRLLKDCKDGHRSRHEDRNEPRYEVGAEAPEWLTGKVARDMWRKIAPVLTAQRVLTVADGEALGRYCDVYEKWLALAQFLRERGTAYAVYEKTVLRDEIQKPDGTIERTSRVERKQVGAQAYPQAKQYKEYGETLLKLEREFGLTPASRTKIFVPDLGGRYGGYGDDDSDLED